MEATYVPNSGRRKDKLKKVQLRVADPQNLKWKNDTSNFGFKVMLCSWGYVV
jgi:hypothetical protein